MFQTVSLAQITASVFFLIIFLIAYLEFRKYPPKSIYFFEAGLFLFVFWAFFHFLGNVMQSVVFFLLATMLGLLALQMLLLFISSLDSTRTTNFRTVFGLVLLSALLSSFFQSNFQISQVIMASGDNVFLIKNTVYYALEGLFVGYVFLVYTIITLKIALKSRDTQHIFYAWLQFIAVVITTSIIGFVELIYVKMAFKTLLIELYALTFYTPLAYALVTTVTLVCDRGLYTAFLYKLSRLIVFEPGGTSIFAFDFHSDSKHRSELIAGMISAIITAVSEVTESTRYVEQIVLEDKIILLNRRENLFFALIADKATKMIVDSFNSFIDVFTSRYKSYGWSDHSKRKAIPVNEALECVYLSFPYIAHPKFSISRKQKT